MTHCKLESDASYSNPIRSPMKNAEIQYRNKKGHGYDMVSAEVFALALFFKCLIPSYAN